MEKSERIKLLRALTKASNAFHDSLCESGYDVSYDLGNSVGGVIDLSKKSFERFPLASLEIKWKIKD